MSIAAYQIENSGHQRVCIIIGLGLVGGAISKHLGFHSKVVTLIQQQPTDWSNSNALFVKIQSCLESVQCQNIEIVWSAGNAGFSATDLQMDAEYDFFSQVVNRLCAIGSHPLIVNLLSSAGGIYENSGYVDNISSISPSRPYAHCKLRQEKLLSDLGLPHRIYRISTVYGAGGSRLGLVRALLQSAMLKKPMVIYANQNTLRDYVFNVDVAKNIVADILTCNCSSSPIKILASGRATSIDMLLNIVRKVSKQTVVASFKPDQSNNSDIVFARNVVSTNLVSSSLEECLLILHKRLQAGFDV